MVDLRAALNKLICEHGLLALKAGTEWEDMDYAEIAHLYALGQGKISIFVKVAGPEANVDLRHLREIGVDGILGPMIESAYALEKFVATAQQAYDGSDINLKLAINIETIQGYKSLDTILNSPSFQ